MYGLCDCNNFFASCERVFRPEYNGRPVVVLSNNDGCVIARSNEAKAMGIRMGHPFFQIRELVLQKKVKAFSSNFHLYGDMSRRVIWTLRRMVPAAEVYSIDEAFLDLRGIQTDELQELGHNICRTVRRDTGIPVSIGIAPTKTLAKIAAKLCKDYPKLQGTCLMHRPEDIEKVLRRFPIEDVWGIGRKHRRKLQAAGILTAWDFTQRPSAWIRGRMGVTGLRTWRELQGEPCIDFENAPAPKQQITVSRSFARQLFEYEDIHSSVAMFTSMCAEKLRRQQSLCAEITVFILTNRHREDLPQYYESETIRATVPTDDTLELVPLATKALERIFRKGYGYKKAGVTLSEISSRSGRQTDMFDAVDRPKHARLMQVVDTANSYYGRHKIVVASQGFGPLKMNRNYLSKGYTTNWKEIITVKATP
ncbi:Y-family DNA polymerase [uncultured Alistipes sp.]|jgi:nucleotidyltransferase/DNA polymerase involved in DNA repair|uniref:Y-family DNA polymerase n=1 Tax=uncultured Alistipes sp. TaxID=538949 RepID=UPI0025EF3124|nr:Y-family DNA polymerase [uncultured Alistipes sp.]